MEPIAAQNHPIAIRPSAAALHPELATLLRDGRVLAGEVLKTLGHGTFLIGIGRSRVPAQTNLRLEPGHHFLFQVELSESTTILRILGAGAEGESELLRLLRSVIGEERPIGQLLEGIAARIRAELAKPGANTDELGRLLAKLEAHVLQPGADGAELRALLERAGFRYEAALLEAARAGLNRDLFAELGRNLKGELLKALANLPEGVLRDAIARALAGLEAEQLLNLARQQAGEPLLFALPFPDGAGWTTAHLLVRPRYEGEAEENGEPDDDGAQRLVLGVSFSRTGPVRVDLILGDGALTARILVTRQEVANRVSRDLHELTERLGDGSRRVRISVRVGTPEEVAVGSRPLDVRFLHEHRLMDVEG
ncbi:MAG: hypothetical protein O7B99_08170 [Planctomycetota bacterium]|nr:hypothetical protein [Planctomycetota bacterium]